MYLLVSILMVVLLSVSLRESVARPSLGFYRAIAAIATAAAAAPKELSLLPLLPGAVDEGAEGLLPDSEPVGEPPEETVLLVVGKGTEAKVEEEAGGAPPAPAPPGVEEPEEPVV